MKPAPSAPRPPLWAALLVSVVGLVLSLVLVRVHLQAQAGIASFCSISEVINCDRVATSRYAVVLGLPVAMWGVLGYGLAAALAITGLRRSDRSTWPAGLLFVVAAFAVAVSAVLAVVSEVAVGALCLLCAGSWLLTLALLVAARAACRGPGVAACVGDGFSALRSRPGRSAAVAGGGLVLIGIAAAAYPRLSPPRPPTRPAPASAGSERPGSAGAGPASPGGYVVVEYSDYECPFCARAHEETRAILAKRPDITIVRRQFPLDASCNPALTKSIHPSACTLARAGICAQAQGRFAEMDDALFRNQRENLSPFAVAEQLGLDADRFRACMTSPETERRLQGDIAAAMRDGARATPTYVVGGVARAGEFPLDLLPPAPAHQTAR